jgi:hypothetical protein
VLNYFSFDFFRLPLKQINMKKILLFALLAVISFASCRKDSLTDTTTTTGQSPIPKEYVKATVYGLVIDQNDAVVANAQVTIVTKSGPVNLTTDKNGAFQLQDAIVNSKGTYVKVTQNGFFHGSKVINPRLGSRTACMIQLLSNTSTKTINSVTGGTADYGDFSIALPAGARLKDASGNLYNGQVGVAAHKIDPSQKSFGLQAPGRLEGLTTGGDVTGLISLGQMAVELRAANGDLLQLDSITEATLRLKVAPNSQTLAKSTIPMWWFDETIGIWKEEGSATLNNGWYECTVKHFTFWNWDFINPSVLIDFKFVDSSGNIVTNVYLDIQATVSHTHGAGSPDADGHLIGNVPANEPLIAHIYTNPFGGGCSSAPLLVQNIGSFSTPTQVCFVVPTQTNGTSNVQITGRLLDCAGNPVTNGYARIQGRTEILTTNANGEYSTNLYFCGTLPTSLSVYGIDLTAFKESDPVPVNITGAGTYAVPDITVCNNLTEYFILNDSTDTYTYPEVWASVDSFPTSTGTYIFVEAQQNSPRVSFFVDVNNGLTTYQPGTFQVYKFAAGTTSGYACDANCTDMVVTITEYGGQGGYIAGSFTGTLPSVILGEPDALFSGTFRAKID